MTTRLNIDVQKRVNFNIASRTREESMIGIVVDSVLLVNIKMKDFKSTCRQADGTTRENNTIRLRLLFAARKDLNQRWDQDLNQRRNQDRIRVGIERLRDDTSKSEVLKLMSLGAEFRRTNRGGLITFHGPGQLVAYPIINLKNFKPSVKWYVHSLEETVINLCRELGLYAYRSPDTGVWVNDNKLAAIGIHASRYITTHGIALNCDNNLSWFNHIVPCGIIGKGVTSLTKETGQHFTVTKIIPMFIDHFSQVFDCQTELLNNKTQADILNDVYTELMEKPEVN
ncbi:hypothetical protein EVAR_64779_1 [Eumeta japonica]|uniref:lipoyl(octanoyl) transferase n=1 Tax=Eumeta variegata TaxID=151549 RepID=A0A4C1ZR09_EUMVA|nr:hypothetical protein EVAR_64779_1 [Eumeta japonica]